MTQKFDLNILRDEISTRTNEKNRVSTRLGENISNSGNNLAPRDSFLSGLLESFNTGKETPSTILVKTYDNAMERKGNIKLGTKLPIKDAEPTRQQTQQPNRINEGDMSSAERDEQLYLDVERKRKQTLAEQMGAYTQTPNIGAPMNNNYVPQQPQQQMTGAPMQINEAYLTENVKTIVNNYLVENFGPIVEEAIKSTILEMYAVERIKEVLGDNKEMIKSIVFEAFRELKAKNEAKRQ